MHIKGASFEVKGPLTLAPNLTLQITEFIYTHDIYTNQTIEKQNK